MDGSAIRWMRSLYRSIIATAGCAEGTRDHQSPPLSDFLFDDPGNVLLQDVTVDGLLSRYRAFIG